MLQGEWQLPVIERQSVNEQYIKHNAKYHFYVNVSEKPEFSAICRPKKSMCGRHIKITEGYESVTDSYIINNNSIACKKCLEMWKKKKL